MSSKKHRLFTRWFSRKIDLGVVFSTALFVFIWFFLPSSRVDIAMGSSSTGNIHIQVTRSALCDVLPYRRPDLMLVPSRYTFTPLVEASDELLTDVPHYGYVTSLDVIFSAPEGMGRLAELSTGVSRNDHSVLLVPSSVATDIPRVSSDDATPGVHVRASEGLGATRLRTDAMVWEPELALDEAWKFAFWVSFPVGEPSGIVFVEHSSGDVARDLRLVGIVERLDVWDNPVGEGIVWLRYEPITGGIDANQDD